MGEVKEKMPNTEHEYLEIDVQDKSEIFRLKKKEKPKICRVDINQALSCKLDSFIPQILKDNEEFAELNEEKVNIEDIDSGYDVIELDLYCGILEEKDGDDSFEYNDSSPSDDGSEKEDHKRPLIEEMT